MKRPKTVVIGGSGHIGSYLVPMLATRNFDVTVFSRGNTHPYPKSVAWDGVELVRANREEEEKSGRWQERLENASPDVIVDIVCMEPESARLMADFLQGRDTHLISIGTVWVYGKTEIVPTPEWAPRYPENEYAGKKTVIEQELIERTRSGQIRATVIHPGHITGPGKPFITPFGDNDPSTVQKIILGEEVFLLDGGFATLHHVHPSDVAGMCFRALEKPSEAEGESFNCCASHAMTFYGLGRFIARLFEREFLFHSISLEEYSERFGIPEMAALHVRQGCCVSMQKALDLLDFTPRYSPEEAVREAIDDMITRGVLK